MWAPVFGSSATVSEMILKRARMTLRMEIKIVNIKFKKLKLKIL